MDAIQEILTHIGPRASIGPNIPAGRVVVALTTLGYIEIVAQTHFWHQELDHTAVVPSGDEFHGALNDAVYGIAAAHKLDVVQLRHTLGLESGNAYADELWRQAHPVLDPYLVPVDIREKDYAGESLWQWWSSTDWLTHEACKLYLLRSGYSPGGEFASFACYERNGVSVALHDAEGIGYFRMYVGDFLNQCATVEKRSPLAVLRDIYALATKEAAP